MPDTVTDIIHRITYETNKSAIDDVNKAFDTQFNELKALQAEQAKLNELMAKQGNSAAVIQQLNQKLGENKQRIDAVTTSIGKQVSENQKLSRSLVDVSGRLRGVAFSGSQLLREAPAFTYSIQTGILALSNNIPILLDQLKQARADGASTGQIFKALGNSVFGLTGLVTIAVSALTIFGGKLFSTGQDAKDATGEIKNMTSAIEAQIDAANRAVTREAGRQNIGANAARQRLELLRAQGASEAEILNAQRVYRQEVQRGFENDAARYEVIIESTRDFFNRFNQLDLTEKEKRKRVAAELIPVLRETLDIPKKQAEEEAKAIADTYNTSESVIKKFSIKRAELLEKSKDEANNILTDEAAYHKQLRDREARSIKERDELYQKLIQSLRELRREYDATAIAQSKVAPEEPLVLPGDENDLFKNRKDPGTGVVDLIAPPSEDESALLLPLFNLAKFNEEQRQKKKKQEAQDDEERKRRIKDNVDAAIQAEQTIFDVFLTINAAKQQLLDLQYERQVERVRQAEYLAERGNAEELKAEQDKLTAITAEREKAARTQIQLNALLQASNAAVALTEALLVVTNAGKTGDPYSTPVRIAAAVAALAAGFAIVQSLATAFNSNSFAEGGYTGDGDKNAPAGIVHKGEFVITKERTAQYRPLLEAIHEGKINPMALYQSSAVNNSMDTKRLEQGLAEVKDAIEMNRVNVKQVMDMYGLTQSVESYQNKQRRLWKR